MCAYPLTSSCDNTVPVPMLGLNMQSGQGQARTPQSSFSVGPYTCLGRPVPAPTGSFPPRQASEQVCWQWVPIILQRQKVKVPDKKLIQGHNDLVTRTTHMTSGIQTLPVLTLSVPSLPKESGSPDTVLRHHLILLTTLNGGHILSSFKCERVKSHASFSNLVPERGRIRTPAVEF